MPQVSDFIGENTDIWNFNNLNIDFHPILPTYAEFNDESAKVQVLCKNHFLSKNPIHMTLRTAPGILFQYEPRCEAASQIQSVRIILDVSAHIIISSKNTENII